MIVLTLVIKTVEQRRPWTLALRLIFAFLTLLWFVWTVVR